MYQKSLTLSTCQLSLNSSGDMAPEDVTNRCHLSIVLWMKFHCTIVIYLTFYCAIPFIHQKVRSIFEPLARKRRMRGDMLATGSITQITWLFCFRRISLWYHRLRRRQSAIDPNSYINWNCEKTVSWYCHNQKNRNQYSRFVVDLLKILSRDINRLYMSTALYVSRNIQQGSFK